MVVQTPKVSRSKLSKKHALQPQIFLQLELSSQAENHIDPSTVGILNDVRKVSNCKNGHEDGCEEYLAHVRLQHCTELPTGQTDIRLEGPAATTYLWLDEDADEHEPKCAETPPLSSEDNGVEICHPSPDGGLLDSPNHQNYGRHDHLLEPLPNELFERLPCQPSCTTQHQQRHDGGDGGLASYQRSESPQKW